MPRRLLDDVSRFKYPATGYYDVRQMFLDYSKDRLIAKGKDPVPAWRTLNLFMRPGLVEPSAPAKKVGAPEFEDYTAKAWTTTRPGPTARCAT